MSFSENAIYWISNYFQVSSPEVRSFLQKLVLLVYSFFKDLLKFRLKKALKVLERNNNDIVGWSNVPLILALIA